MTSISHKNNAFKLSDQVEKILREKGFSSVFNINDYRYFKKQAKNAFNKAHAIAELFISDNPSQNNDFSQYQF